MYKENSSTKMCDVTAIEHCAAAAALCVDIGGDAASDTGDNNGQ